MLLYCTAAFKRQWDEAQAYMTVLPMPAVTHDTSWGRRNSHTSYVGEVVEPYVVVVLVCLGCLSTDCFEACAQTFRPLANIQRRLRPDMLVSW